jgi:flagellar hook-associated protein 1 FlgK
MGLSAAITTAVSGLRATQAGMEVVSQNVANSGTPGYTRRVLNTTERVADGVGAGVNVGQAQRVLDTLVQRQLRLETAGAAYTSVKSDFHASIDGMFDAPGSSQGLPALTAKLNSSVSALVSNPSSYTTKAAVLANASELATSLRSLSDQVQSLRQQAEDAMGLYTWQVNHILQHIKVVTSRMSDSPANAESASLLDQRDGLIQQLSEFFDLDTYTQSDGRQTISTTGGLRLFDGVNPVKLAFDGRSAVGVESKFDMDPAKSSVGSLTITDFSGRSVPLLGTGAIRSGKFAAYAELRDQVLPEAQTQLDALAAGLATALSNTPVAGTPVVSGADSGFDLNFAGLSAGNPITVSTVFNGQMRTLTFVKADSAAGAAAATASGDGVIGLDLSGGYGAAASAIATALGTGFTASNTTGSTIRVLGSGTTTSVSAFGLSRTVSGPASGEPALPLFTDGTLTYTGSYENGSKLTGLASRIAVNAQVVADPSLLVQYGPTVSTGDITRPTQLLNALTSTRLAFTGRAGIAGSSSVFRGTIGEFSTQIVSSQASAANSATSLDSGQQIVLSNITSRMSNFSGVNVDTELAQLIQLQTAYSANARVMSVAKEMLDTLMRVGL